MKRVLLLFLALVLLLGCLAACNGSSGNKRTLDDDDDLAPLREADYSGKTYTVLYRQGQRYEEEWIANEGSGADVISDAIAVRNQKVINRYGVELDYDTGMVPDSGMAAWNDFWGKITTNTDDDTYQLIAGNTYRLATASVTGLCLNWLNKEQVPVVDLQQAWWDSDFAAAAQYNNCLYTATGPLSLTDMYSSACVYFNKTLLNEFKLSDTATADLFNLVREGKWTLDQLEAYAKACTYEVQGAENDESKIYGLSTNWNTPIDAYIYSSNLKMTERRSGTIVLKPVNASNPIVNLASKLQTFHNSKSVYMYGAKTSSKGTYKFVDAKSVFCTGILENAKDIKNEAPDLEYGVIPYPKLNETQKDYYTYKVDFKTIFAIPRSVAEDNREFVGTITEALAYYSNKYVKDALYEKVLKHQNVQDEESSEFVELIINSGLYEFSNIYACAWGDEESPAHLLRKIVQTTNKDFSAEYSANAERYGSALRDLLKSFASDDAAQ